MTNLRPYLTLFCLIFMPAMTNSKSCYRCRDAMTFSPNLTTGLLAMSTTKPCVLDPVQCLPTENSCVYGLVSVAVAGGFWFHLSGCYIESVNTTRHCIRGVGPLKWPGYSAEFRANYCLCEHSPNGDKDLCNDKDFAKFVITNNSGKRAEISQMPSIGSTLAIRNRSTQSDPLVEKRRQDKDKPTSGMVRFGSRSGLLIWLGLICIGMHKLDPDYG